MTTWTHNELTRIGIADELEITTLRRDGTLRKPVTIWVVRLGDDLYIRSVNGRTSAWFRGTTARREGRIQAGGIDKDVTFVDGNPGINDQIDAAYRSKYHHYPQSVDRINSLKARSTTIQLVPRPTTSTT